jgi:hypothetical protein
LNEAAELEARPCRQQRDEPLVNGNMSLWSTEIMEAMLRHQCFQAVSMSRHMAK